MADVENITQASATSVARYAVDPVISRFIVRAFATGLLSVFGHDPIIAIRSVTGEAQFNPDALQQSSLHLVIRADSLSVTNNLSDKDRREIEREMRESVLETAKFPQIVYDCERVLVRSGSDGNYDVTLQGNLSLHGVTRPQAITARLNLSGDMLRSFGEFRLRQSEYSIRPVSAVGGGLKVKDELQFSFDIVARRQSRSVEQSNPKAESVV
jgi:polyisoprenoid-binding protein YceI